MTDSHFADPPTADRLIEAAQGRTGLSDLGDPGFMAPFAALLDAFRIDAWRSMPTSLREDAVAELTEMLCNRLKLIEDRKRHPVIARGKVDRPLIVVGPARSGTSLLHTLLAQDPANRAVHFWEATDPSPPPGLEKPTPARLAKSVSVLKGMMAAAPEIETMHSYFVEEGMAATEECSNFQRMAFTTNRFWYFYPLPSYHEYLLSADHGPAIAFHRTFLQHVQYPSPEARWTLKSPDHMFWLEELASEYPDAFFVWTHRDLASLFSSVASSFLLTRTLRNPANGDARRVLARECIEAQRDIIEKAMKARDAIGESRFCDISYHEMMTDPVATVRAIYGRSGDVLSDEAAGRIRAWVAQNAQTKHGTHAHAPEDFGFDGDGINRALAGYRERFGFGFGVRRSFREPA